MTNTKITRSISTATAEITFVNMETMNVETGTGVLLTTQKVSEKDFMKKYDNEKQKILKVGEIAYESTLYEMSLETFIENAEKVGTGRTTL